MQAETMAETSPFSPYDVLRPMRCRNEFEGVKCTGRGGDIDWGKPDVHGFRCMKCRAFNVVAVVEVVR